MKLHYFNPGHETAVHNGSPYYMVPANIAAMQQELAYLPAWYGDKGDLVLVAESNSYFSFLNKNICNLPQAITQNELTKYDSTDVSLWGISPQAIHYFDMLNKEYATNLNIPKWHNGYTDLNSRSNAKDCLSEIVKQIPQIQDSIIPRFYTEPEEIDNAVRLSSERLLAKAPYSSSGRGLLWLPVTGLTRTESQILRGILKKQGSVSVERVVDKKTDFAMEFLTDGNNHIQFAGYSLFETNNKGAYESNYIGSQQSIEKELTQNIPTELLDRIKLVLTSILKEKYAQLYKGCIGVDMMIYTDEGEYKLHPCVEINMRFNMGYLALKLFENYITPTSHGRFYLDFNPIEGSIYEQHIAMQHRYPIKFQDGRIDKGYLSLCPIDRDNRYRAYILIE
ncbi:MAG: hypothetical protein LBL79_08630 [Prevotella sp.]|jgi:hypothetical protein|nr:hypothetical protein [Prevotella sp.]